MTTKLILHIRLNTINQHASRAIKEMKSVVDFGLADKVFMASVGGDGNCEVKNLGDKIVIWNVPLKTKKFPKNLLCQIIKYIEWTTKIFLKFRKSWVASVHCHDLSSLPVGMLFKIFKNSKLIYTPHELETERNQLFGIRKRLAKITEYILINHLDGIIAVNDSIAKWYQAEYSLKKVYVIRNIPCHCNIKNSPSNILKEKFNIKKDEILFIYQGALVNGRGIEMILDTFIKSDRKNHVVFMGSGILYKMVKDYESKFLNIHLHPAVDSQSIFQYTSSADIGIHLIKNTCLNHYYCLPNKLFEYLISGLPIIVSNFPEMAKLVDINNCGWKIEPASAPLLYLINNLSPKDIEEKRSNALKCRDNYDWHKEERAILEMYKNFK